MNRFTFTALAAAVVLAGGNAMAQSKQVTPGAQPTQTQTQEPSARSLDDNVQRQHGRDQAAGTTAPQTTAKTPAPTGGSAGGVRNWDAIDTNNDNLIQPEEMEAALKETGPQAGKK